MEDAGADVNLVLGYMDDAQNGLNIVILDACRDNPFARSFRSATNGLAQVDAPTGTLIAYATAPGRVASDGTGQNGLYPSELLKQMRVPGLSVTEMFMHVRAEVMKQTGNKQVPWEASSLVGTFYYFSAPPKNGTSPTMNAAANETKIDPIAVEREYWESIRSSTSPQDYQDYLANYPNGAYAAIARAKLRQLDAQVVEANKITDNPNKTADASHQTGGFGSAVTDNSGVKPKDGFGSTPPRPVTVRAFTIQLQSCKISGGDVTCDLTVTNTTASDKEFALCQSDYRVTVEERIQRRRRMIWETGMSRPNPLSGPVEHRKVGFFSRTSWHLIFQ